MKVRNRRRPGESRQRGRKSFPKRDDGHGDDRTRGGFSNILLIACAVFAMLVAGDHWLNSGQVYRGVEVGSVAVGGQSPDEARSDIEENVFGAIEEIEVAGTGADGNASIGGDRLSLSFDATATAAEAYAVGREGSIPKRLADRMLAALGMVVISPATDYDPNDARSAVAAVAAEMDEAPRDASVEVRGSEANVVEAADGYETDVEATLESVERAVVEATGEAEISGEPLEPAVPTEAAERAASEANEAMEGGLAFSADGERWDIPPAAVGAALDFEPTGENIRVSLDREAMRENLSGVYASLTVEPTEAGYVAGAGDEISVVPEEAGRGIREEIFMERLEAGVFEGERNYEIPVASVEPELSTAEAERLKPTTLLGEYATDYTWDTDPGRRVNMGIASDALSGTFVAPGEAFSFNEITSPLAYEQAKVIVEGAAEYADGGGVSQVSSTLYMTANLAGLEILEAHPHSAELPYIQPGLDTTVWFGALDLRFRNNTSGYIFIRQWQGEDGLNHATIHGTPTGKEVSVTSDKVYDGTDAEGDAVTRWAANKTITQNGEVVEDGVFRTVTYRELEPYEGPPPTTTGQ
ncbi:MAG: VanW family protein [Actinomycetota bacterium]|nr:VanW family protein [Rubrobacter sp.]MDQ3508976.1 VanW family protein [Actinomycetota bacterium]